MRCTRCGTEASPDDTDGWAARGPDDENVRCLECIIGAHQTTEVRFAPARLGQWVQDQVRENQLRDVAKRQGRTLMKSCSRESRADDSDRYWLSTVDNDSHSWGSHPQTGPDAEMTLDGVEDYLIYRTTHAEIVEYLTQTYGPAFVEDLIKHLPQLRAEALNRAQLRGRISASATVN